MSTTFAPLPGRAEAITWRPAQIPYSASPAACPLWPFPPGRAGTRRGCRVSFDASVWDILLAHLAGASLRVVTGAAARGGPALFRFLRDAEITVATLTPSVLSVLPDGDLPALRLLVSAGEVCPPAVVRRWAPGRRFVDAYGPTEATVCATIARLRRAATRCRTCRSTCWTSSAGQSRPGHRASCTSGGAG